MPISKPKKELTMPRLVHTQLLLLSVFSIFVVIFAVSAIPSGYAQTFTVLHAFTGGADGGNPAAGLTIDSAGNLYGTTQYGGSGYGTAFTLVHQGSGWLLSPLYSFSGGSDGANPSAGVVFGPQGSLYGTTQYGQAGGCNYGTGCGTVFNLRPQATTCRSTFCSWSESVLYSFTGVSDGAAPALGDVIFDSAGNMYGTTLMGGAYSAGTVFELTPSGSGWSESILYSFTGGSDGGYPWAGLTLDSAGNLYGTTVLGGANEGGTVFQLTSSGAGWTENVLYSFEEGNDGGYPYGGLVFDPSGNLYGTTADGGQGGGGTVFKLTPSHPSWTFSLVYSLSGGLYCGSTGNLIMDSAANLYGTTQCDGAYGQGTVFKLTPSGGSWTYTSLHDFGGGGDGANPVGGVTLDSSGNLYSTASSAGTNGQGLVFEITP
jgi:uncharacterized repeat protein (TIGR03803 family)